MKTLRSPVNYLSPKDFQFKSIIEKFVPITSKAYALLEQGFFGNRVNAHELEKELITISINKELRIFLQSMMIVYEIYPINGH